MTGVQGETRRCYNCGEIGHLRRVCPKPPKEIRVEEGSLEVGVVAVEVRDVVDKEATKPI
jgi:Zinc knuckle